MNVSKRPQAERDIEDIFVYIGERNIDATIRFLSATEGTFDFLAKMPFLGSSRDFLHSRLRNLRQWTVTGFESYLIFYKPTDDGI